MTKSFTYLLLAVVFLGGCAGARHSYKELIENGPEGPSITLQEGEEREVLAVGDGLPGWWGYYPAVYSCDPTVASIHCEEARSPVPFREPGLLFGGEICSLKGEKAGTTTMLIGNRFAFPAPGSGSAKDFTGCADQGIKIIIIPSR